MEEVKRSRLRRRIVHSQDGPREHLESINVEK
jgi:hypothetical protein